MNANETYKRIIFGIKSLQDSFKNYFYRSVTGKSPRPLPTDLANSTLQQSGNLTEQFFYFSANYELYR